ncbi:MAG: hypothetical protein IT337_11075 [Thermomicrobiales bacterium]|nr:hypothetical protein [Thermomicrobiales bacterium]
MNRILRIRRRVESGMYDDPGIIDAKLNGACRKRFLERVGIDDPDVVHPDARGAAGVTIALALLCGALAAIVVFWVAMELGRLLFGPLPN